MSVFNIVTEDFTEAPVLNKSDEFCRIMFASTISSTKTEPGVSYCNTTWDGFSCWPRTPENTLAVMSCPKDIYGVDPTKNATRQCYADGIWADRSDYTNCLSLKGSNDFAEPLAYKLDLSVRIIYSVGFIITTVSLVVALAIFLYFRSLRCLRNIIHSHLILTFIARNIIWIIIHSTLLHLWNTDLEWLCKVLVTLYNYLHGTNFFWMFIEGLYLFTIIVWAYSADKIRLWYYLIIGWGIPLLYTIAWALVRYNYDDFGCWLPSERGHYDFILHIPIFAVLLSNMFFLASIIWVLITKLKASPNIETRQYRKAAKATIILFPLLGVTYVLFLMPPSSDAVVRHVFKYANALLQSFQGLFVAVFYCFLNGEVKAVLRKKMNNFQENRSITSRYTKTSFIGSPMRSSIRDHQTTAIAITHINGKYDSKRNSDISRASTASHVIEEENML